MELNATNVTSALIVLAIDIIIRVIAVLVVPRNRRPTTGIAWLMAIFFIPYVGLFLFLLLGSNKLPRKRREKQEFINNLIAHSTDNADTLAVTNLGEPWVQSVVRMNRELGAVPMIGGNHISLQGGYEATIAAMAAEVDRATHFVHVEFYILACDRTTSGFFDALDRAIARGVTVRILLDHIASIRVPGYRKNTLRRLQKIAADGGQWHYMLPVRPWRGEYQRPDLRNHRKLLIVDGHAAYLGSQNLVDSSYNKRQNRRRGLHWHDLMVRMTGPSVQALNAIFLTDWFSETNEQLVMPIVAARSSDHDSDTPLVNAQVVPSGPGFKGENNLRLFLALLYSAQRTISITSPYFVPDESMMYAITSATQRGVYVELFVSEIGDQPTVYHAQRSYYGALLDAGVRIWMYRPPTILHAKHFTIDDDIAVIGSSNMDMRSFSLNYEISLMVQGSEFVAALREIQQDYREASRELTAREWAQQPLRSQLLDNLARLTSALQ